MLLCLALREVKCGLLSEWVTQTQPNLFICLRWNKISNSGAAMIVHRFTSSSCGMPIILHFSVPLAEYSPFIYLWRKLEAHCNLNVFCYTQICADFLENKKLVLCVSTISGGRNESPWNLPSIKTPNSLKTFSSEVSKSSTIPNILFQKLTELKMEARKSFT